MRVIAIVPSLVLKVVDFTDVVASVKGSTVVCDAVQLVRGLTLASVFYKRGASLE